MDLTGAVIVGYVAVYVAGVFPRGVVKINYRLVQDIAVLVVLSVVLHLLVYPCTAAVVLAAVAAVIYNDLPAPWIDPRGKAVLITGCDRGLGHALALRLDQLGMRVFAGCLFLGGDGEKALVKAASDRLVTIQMDVTDPAQVTAAAATVKEALGGQGLHGVVNNAGYLLAANMEVISWPDIRKIMDINLMGVISVYRAFVPLLRQRRSEGSDREMTRLVNVSSNTGLAPAGQLSAYVASKAAIAQLSETWRFELRQLGVRVATIVPSGFKTGILMYDKEAAADRWWQAADQEVRDYFGRACFIAINKKKDYKDYLNPDMSGIVECMADALLSRHPRPFYYKGLIARCLPWLFHHSPSCLWDLIMPHLADFYHFPVEALRSEGNSHSEETETSLEAGT